MAKRRHATARVDEIAAFSPGRILGKPPLFAAEEPARERSYLAKIRPQSAGQGEGQRKNRVLELDHVER